MTSTYRTYGILHLMRALRYILFVVQLVCCMFTIAQKHAIQFGHLETNLGLSHVNVMGIVQDSRGFMWFATANGLNKYDGNQFTIYKQDIHQKNALGNNYVTSLLLDAGGNLWIGSAGGLQRYDAGKDHFIQYEFPIKDLPDNSGNGITVLLEDSKHNLWIGTEANGLICFDKTNNRFVHYQVRTGITNAICSNLIKSLFEDSDHNLWIGTSDGLNLLDKNRKTFTLFRHNAKDNRSLSNNTVTAISEDSNHHLWIGTYGGGLDLYNKSTGEFYNYKNEPGNSNSLVNNKISAIRRDNAGNMWIGTENDGLSIFNPSTNKFNNYQHDDIDKSSLNDNSFNYIYKDFYGNMWMGTYSGGVDFWNKDGGLFAHYKHSPLKNSLSSNKVLSIYEDSKQTLWIGTDGGGLNLFDRNSGLFTAYRHNPKNKNSIGGDNILDIIEDSKANLWIGTWGEGISVLNRKTNTWRHFKNDPLKPASLGNNFSRVIYEDRDSNIWIGSAGGGLDLYDRRQESFIHYKHDNNDSASITTNFVISIFEDRDGILWIGTAGGGLNLFDKKTGIFRHIMKTESVYIIHEDQAGNLWLATQDGMVCFDRKAKLFSIYTMAHGLPDNGISGILQETKDKLWISTINGLCRFNLSTKSVKKFNVEDGLQSNHFNEAAFCKAKNGNMYFGGVNGFNEFFPASVKENDFEPPLKITGFEVFNKEVPIAVDENDPSPLKKHISETDEIKLPYSSSVISFEFAALNYTTPGKKQYAYMLENFDKEWNNIGANHKATYTNLDPGTYNFKVRTSKSNGAWSANTVSIRLIITPPFWLTWWFKVAFVITMAGTIIGFYFIRINTVKVQKASLQQQVHEQTRQLVLSANEEHKAREAAEQARADAELANNELKKKNKELEQFAYVASHDLQEPLRTTAGFVELIQQQYRGKLDEKADKYLDFILDASDRMKVLIKDLLDFSRIGAKAELKRIDCNSTVKNMLADVSIAVQEANAEIQYAGLPVVNGYPTEIKLLFQNLVLNAIKFGKKDIAPHIIISAKKAGSSWEFAISDNGIGIEEKHFERIFDIFQRLHTRRDYTGSGIGLAHCKKVVDLHNGKIWVKSTPGEGSTFYFTLPANGSGFEKETLEAGETFPVTDRYR